MVWTVDLLNGDLRSVDMCPFDLLDQNAEGDAAGRVRRVANGY